MAAREGAVARVLEYDGTGGLVAGGITDRDAVAAGFLCLVERGVGEVEQLLESFRACRVGESASLYLTTSSLCMPPMKCPDMLQNST